MPLWQHPLVLPVILLKHELAMIRKISRVQSKADRTDVWGKLLSSSREKMSELFAGIQAPGESGAGAGDPMENLKNLICISINVRLAIHTARKCATFLLGVLDSMDNLQVEFAEPQRQHMMNQQIKDIINCLDNKASRLEVGNDGVLATMEVQLAAVSKEIDCRSRSLADRRIPSSQHMHPSSIMYAMRTWQLKAASMLWP